MDTNDDDIPSGMLSSPQIEYYIKKHSIVQNYKSTGLRSASYDMRIGGKVLKWENGKKIEIDLVDVGDSSNNKFTYVELEPNSLSFVTTIEKFKLRRDIIARFNLKSKWVHKGLLLGTGPIVDPELNSNLLIPIHNFSNKSIFIDYGEELISVEFTKTLSPDQQITLNNTSLKYVENRSKFKFDDYIKKIADAQIESSVLSELRKHKDLFEKFKTQINRFSWGGALAIVAIFVGIAGLIIASWDLWRASNATSIEAASIVKEYKGQNIDFRSFALKTDTDERIDKIQQRLESIGKRVQFTTYNSYDQKINELEEKIEKLENANKNVKQ